jgi:hypothetical protein
VLARHHAVAVLVQQAAVGLVPHRPFPADRLEEERAQLDLAVVHRREPLVAVALPLLARVDDAVGLVERLAGARLDVRASALVRVEAGDVGVAQVDLGQAVGHPLGDGAPDARALLDPDGRRGPQPLDLGKLAEDGGAVGRQRQQPVDGVPDLCALGAQQVGHQLEGLLELGVEVLLRERHLGRRQLRLVDRRDVLRVVEDRTVRVRADLHVGAVLALVAEGVHVADDREGDLAFLLGEHRHRTDADHLVHGGRQRDVRAGQRRDLRAPHPAADDHGLGLDVAAGRTHPLDRAVLDVEADHLDRRNHGQGVQLQRPLAHDGAGPQGVDDADARRPEGADNDRRIEERHLLDNLLGRHQLGLDAPALRRRHPSPQLLHPLLGAGHLKAARLGEHAHLLVLAHAVEGEIGDLARVVDREYEVRGVAGRSARVRKGPLVDLHDVAPAESREVVDEAVAHDPRADDDDTG